MTVRENAISVAEREIHQVSVSQQVIDAGV
jgi:hypothetical protein